MDTHYLIGVALAILSGVLNQYGQVLQKKAVNEIPPEVREQRFMRTLMRHPLWIIGMVLALGFGSVAFMFAQGMIGPALVPGLMASGLIVLAIGSVKMNKETLDKTEGLGIVLMIVGILLLGMSQLGINSEQVRVAMADRATWLRITVFTLSLLFLWGVLHLLAFRSVKRKGIILGVSNGFPFCLSNFWISPLVAVIIIVLTGKGTIGQIFIFVLACILIVGTNILGIWQTQEAFKYAQASNIIPVQQVPVQTTPIIVYFYVFWLNPPKTISIVYILSGVFLIILSGFLLGKRQSSPETNAVHGGEVQWER